VVAPRPQTFWVDEKTPVRALDADIRSEPAANPPAFSAVGAVLMPLLHRIRLGEGGLIGMATWAAAWESRQVGATVCVFVLTSLLLAALYLYNDVSDRAVDSYNPAKVPEHRELLLRRPRAFYAVALAVHALVCVSAWILLGPRTAACAVLLLVLNPLYSSLAKRVPGLDVVVVGAMGATVVGFATASASLLLIAGAMTGISHAFQTRDDKIADRAAGIRSSATAAAPAREAIWLALCATFAWTVYERLGLPSALSVVIPYLLLSRADDANRAWGWARVYFAVMWIAATLR
jgi:4-hydroxybenzoate polyprenyltransferase